MKLFPITRYGSDSKSNKIGCISKVTEKERLAELLSKVQKRKESIKKKRSATIKAAVAKKKLQLAGIASSVTLRKTNSTSVTSEVLPVTENTPAPHESTSEQPSQDSTDGFTVIGKDYFKKTKGVKAPLPRWLAHPTIITGDMSNLKVDVDDADYLSQKLKEHLIKNGVSKFFAVQSEVIPWLLQEYKNSLTGYWPRDICVSAPTGSGKTLAFVLPIVQTLQSELVRAVRALVVLPTQDLARQVSLVFQQYCAKTKLRVVLITGQKSLQAEQSLLVSQDALGFHALADIIVTTPGRLVHHLRDTRGLSLHRLRFLVVDEADRVMDGAQSNWLHHLDQHLSSLSSQTSVSHQPCQAPDLTIANLLNFKPPPQKLLFSATMSHDPEKLAQLGLFQPKLFTCIVKPSINEENNSTGHEEHSNQLSVPAEIDEYLVNCEDEGAKPLLLYCLLLKDARKHWKKSLCFASSRLAAHRLALLLSELSVNTKSGEPFLQVAEISAQLRLPERDAILAKFAQGELDVIVSSDALARGIDIPEVDCVVSYDVPQLAQLYVHRIGRTGRAGHKGTAITLLGPQQQPSFEHMLRSAGKLGTVKLMEPPFQEMEVLEKTYCSALATVKKNILKEEMKSLKVIKVKKTAKGTKKKNNKAKKSSLLDKGTNKIRKREKRVKRKIIH